MAWTSRNSSCTLVVVLTLVLFASPLTCADEENQRVQYPFVKLDVSNQREKNMCLGIAVAISYLEEAMETDDVDISVKELADQIWADLRGSTPSSSYPRFTLLQDGTRVRTCSQVAIRELAILLQEYYEQFVDTELWQVGVTPDPETDAGRSLLQLRDKYLDCYRDGITSKDQLRTLIKNDTDGLVAIAGRGLRSFKNRPPQELIDKYNLTIDPISKAYPAVPSLHAFLVTYDEQDDSFFVYDSDDPDRKWLALDSGSGKYFTLDWYIHDHMGNGPTHQTYHELKPIPELFEYFRRIHQDHDAAADTVDRDLD